MNLQSFASKRSFPYTKKNLDSMIKRTTIFLLQFFEKIWINQGKAERKIEGARIKKVYYYLPPLTKRLPIGALPMSYNSSHPPSQEQFCDYYNNISNNYMYSSVDMRTIKNVLQSWDQNASIAMSIYHHLLMN
jgi:hypothetical protein